MPAAVVAEATRPDRGAPLNELALDDEPGDAIAQSVRRHLLTRGMVGTVLASVDVGLQLYRAGSFEARAEYSLKGANNYLSQTAAARIAYHF